MSRVLIVLPHIYPYSHGESFVGNEREAWQQFDRIIICPLYVLKDHTIRSEYIAKENEFLINPNQVNLKAFEIIRGLFSPISPINIFREMWVLVRSKRLSFSNIKKTLFITFSANSLYWRSEKCLENNELIRKDDDVLVYSYWFYESALVGACLKKRHPKWRFVSRAHRNDLYEEDRGKGYIPYREYLLKACDNVYPISENGKKYLLDKYGNSYADKIIVRRLGTLMFWQAEEVKAPDSKVLVLVSCSGLIRLKRVNRIIDALKHYKGICQWYHFGDGELFDRLQNDANELPTNISPKFMGYVPNDVVQQFYSTHYIDAFINVSESEGVPVSIMEAQSYGIPVIATDVGGTGELVHDGENGVLLDKDFATQDLLDSIEEVKNNSLAFRKNAKETWQALSNAEQNYNDMFSYEISQLETQRQ